MEKTTLRYHVIAAFILLDGRLAARAILRVVRDPHIGLAVRVVLECFKLHARDHLVNRVAALEAIRFAAFAFVGQQRDGRQLLNGKSAVRCRTPADRLIVLFRTTQKCHCYASHGAQKRKMADVKPEQSSSP